MNQWPFYPVLQQIEVKQKKIKQTDLEEGKLYNLISRIYLFLEEIINFYTVLGIVKEGQRIENIKKNILRGIMGVQSLYLQDNINFDINK